MSETTMSESRLAEHKTDFDRFVAKGELQPVYQPIVDLIAGGVVGFEALARWPNLYGATPDVVFAAARNNGGPLNWTGRVVWPRSRVRSTSDLVGITSSSSTWSQTVWERPSRPARL